MPRPPAAALAAALALTCLGLPALAGDPAAGGTAFASQCQNCHHIVDPAGEVLAGRANMRTGPNLYGVIGRTAGTLDGFRYGASIVEAGAAGLVWEPDDLVPYLLDPNTFLRERLDDRRARSQMAFRVRDEATAQNVIAFLAQFGAPPAETEAEAEGEDSTEAEGEAAGD